MYRAAFDAFSTFDDLRDSLSPQRGSLYDEDMRNRAERRRNATPTFCPSGGHGHRRMYSTEERMPSTSYGSPEHSSKKTHTHRHYHTEDRHPTSNPFSRDHVHNDRDEYSRSRVPPRESSSYSYKYSTYRASSPPSSPVFSQKGAGPYNSSSSSSSYYPRGTKYSTQTQHPSYDKPPQPKEHTSTYAHSSSNPRGRAYYTSSYTYSDSSYPSTSSSSSRTSTSSSSSSRSSDSSSSSTPLSDAKSRVDLYKVLNLSRTASSADVKRAHRVMSLKWHPDRCGAESKERATQKMAEVNLARDVLGDEGKRAYYDKWGVVP